MSDTCDFDSLLQRALSNWPSELRFGQLELSGSGKHFISGLNKLATEISSSYVGGQDEILIRTMSDAILDGIHGFAVFCDTVKPALLRRDFLKRRFEARLRGTVLIGKGLRWSDQDIALAEAYLDAEAESQKDFFGDTPSTAPTKFFPIKGTSALLNWEDGSVWEVDNDSSPSS